MSTYKGQPFTDELAEQLADEFEFSTLTDDEIDALVARHRGHVPPTPARFALAGHRFLVIGPARDGELLEIGVVVDDSGNDKIVHAMKLRPAYYRFLSNDG